MVVGVCLIELHIPESNSLKSKRQVVRRIKDRVKNKFNVSVAEIGDNDLWQKAVLGISTISNDKKFASQILCSVVNAVEKENGAVILSYNTEFI